MPIPRPPNPARFATQADIDIAYALYEIPSVNAGQEPPLFAGEVAVL